MAIKFYHEFVRSKDDTITKGKYYSINIACARPRNIGFRLHTFGDDPDEKLTHDQRELWEQAGGVDSFLEFEADGYITHPAAFEAKRASLLVNPLGSLDRFKFAHRGSLGDGWYDGQTFLLRIYADLPTAQQLLSTMQSPPPADPDLLETFTRDVTGFDPSAANIRFDLFKVVWQERPQWTSYEICRIYT